MGMKTFDEVGNVGFSKSWQEENKDLLLEFKAGDVREVRFCNLFLPMALHWVPFISKKGGKIRFFPQMCLRWDLDKSVMDDELECPACDRGVHANENGVFWVIDVEALFIGDKNRALKILEVGSRERKKLSNLAKFNKVQGVPQNMGHSKYGRVVQVAYDPNNSDPALRWQFSKGDRLPIKLMNDGTVLKVKIPEGADSDYAGKVFTFEMQDLLTVVVPPSLNETKQKFKRMQVDEAISRLNDESTDKDDDDKPRRDSNKGGKRGSPRRRNEADDDDQPRRRPRRASRDEDDADPEDDFGDDDADLDAQDEKPRGRRGSKDRKQNRRKPKDDDDFGDNDEVNDDFSDDDDDGDEDPTPRRKRNNGKREDKKRNRRKPKDEDDGGGDDEGPACNKKSTKGARCPKHKGCYGHMGEEDTEDCTTCTHKDECIDVAADDED